MGYDGSVKIGTTLDKTGLQKGLSGLGSFAKKGFSVLGSAAQSAAKIATSAIAGVGTAMAGLATSSVTVGMEFEAQMSRVEAISGATAEEFEKLESQAKELGATTAFSATEAAQGMENLASAGFKTEEIIEAMPGMLDLAASSGEDLATSADIAASTLRGFGLEASEAAHVADVLAKNAADTNAAVYDTGEAMKYVAPVANAMGLSLEEVTASIGIMANAGIQGSQAGTALRAALSRLAKPTDAMCTVMEDLGISFFDSEGKMKSLEEMTAMLQTSMEGLTDEEKQNALITLFGQEALSGMLALIEAGPEEIGTLTEAYENCDGAAAEMAATMVDNLKGAVEELGGAAETFQLELYEHMEQPLKELAQKGTEYVNELTEAFKTDGVEGLIEAGSEILANLLVGITEALPSVIEMASGVVTTFCESLKSTPGLAESAAELIVTLTTALIENAGTIITTAIVLVGKMVEGLTEGAPQLIESASNTISDVIGCLAEWAPDFVEAGIAIIVSLIEGIVQHGPEILSQIGMLIQNVIDKIAEYFPQLLNSGASVISNILSGLKDNASGVVSQASEMVSDYKNAITEMLPDILQAGIEIIGELLSGMLQKIPGLIGEIPGMVADIGKSFLNKDWTQVGKDLIGGIKSGVKNAAGGLVNAAVNAASNAISAVKGWLGIASPSKRARKEVGIQIPAGAAAGVEEGTPEFVKASEESAESAVEAMQGVTAKDFVSKMQAKSYEMADNNEMAARNRYQNNGYEPDDPDEDETIIINNYFDVDGTPLVNKTVKQTKKEIAREQRSSQAVKGDVEFA